MLFVSKLTPIVGELLKLSVFKSVAIREIEAISETEKKGYVEYYDTYAATQVPTEVLTFYNRVRLKDGKYGISALRVYFHGTEDHLRVIGYTSNYPYVNQSISYSYMNEELSKQSTYVGDVIITSLDQLYDALKQMILDAKGFLDIKPNKNIHPCFDELISFITDAYGPNFYALDMMSPHITAHTASLGIICETGWGDDYYFNVTKDKKHVAMKVDIDAREVFEGDNSTYRELKEIGEKGIINTIKEFFKERNFIKNINN
ncbi:hypothetical protein [Solibacillus sp. NPDC093137]|uniref:hypothetical protein n=1 Tax=Solibacillus sp. NPDC093137 TaxID=3390678 RepID=UPI003D04DCCC